MRRKRRPPPRAHSISCTDDEWERVRVLAERRGLPMSRYFVECGLNVDPTTEAPSPPRLVLDEIEQRRPRDGLVRIAERTEEVESEEALLTDLFGERAAAAAVERLKARMDSEILDSS